MKKNIMLITLAILLLPLSTGYSAPFYQGKTMKLIVATKPGGGYDFYARLVAKYMHKYLSGVKTIIVKNVPGAGHIIGTNTIYKSKPDALTFGTFNRLSNRRFLEFDVSASDQYRITVTGPAGSDPDVFLYKQGALNSSEGFVEAQEILIMPLSAGRHVIEVYDACIVFGSTANPGVCPNNVPSQTCLDVKVERL